MSSCHLHPGADAAGTCRGCRHEYCSDCLVYSFGPSKPPHCVHCALVAAGADPTGPISLTPPAGG